MILQFLLGAVSIYLLCGLLFAIPFALIGAARIDSHAEHASLGFRLVLIPGAMLLWPFLLRRWMAGTKNPPEDNNSHRRASRTETSI